MSNPNDFVIENGVLKKYVGPGGDVVVPEGVTEIQDGSYWSGGVFRECSRLTSITLPESITRIGDAAFFGCRRLNRINLPMGVMSIGSWAFYYCDSLKNIKLPESVTIIGTGAFSGCKGQPVGDGFILLGDILLGFEGTGGNATVPDGVKHISDASFSDCKSLTSIILPEGVTNIGSSAFSGCSSLKRITLPDCVTSIGSSAFSGCSSLKQITLPDCVTSIGSSAFSDCSSLQGITLPKNLISIEDAAFKGCSSLTSIALPGSLTTIGNSAFSHCSSLTSVTLSEKLTSLEPSIFSECRKLTEFIGPSRSKYFKVEDGVLFSKDSKKLILYPMGKTEEHYVVPLHVERICNNAFENTVYLRTIELPASLRSIGPRAFWGSSLEYVRLPEGMKNLAKEAFNNGRGDENKTSSDPAQQVTVPYVAVYDAKFFKHLVHPIYLGGPIDDLVPGRKGPAVDGFLYTVEHGISEIEPYRNSYITHIQNNKRTYLKKVEDNPCILLFLMEEELLNQKDVQLLIKEFCSKNKPDLTAIVLNYQSKSQQNREAAVYRL